MTRDLREAARECEDWMTDGELERLLRGRKRPRGRRAWCCPDEVTLAAFVDGGLPESARSRVEGHLALCDSCLQDVAAAVRGQESPIPEVPPRMLAQARAFAEQAADGSLSPVWRWSMISAAAGLALVAVIQFWPLRTAPAPATLPAEVRSEPGQSVEVQLLSPKEGSIVGREQIGFRWREVDGAIYYEIQLLTAEGDVLWEGRTEETDAELPRTVARAPGQEVYVWVRAHLLDGRTLKSRPLGFTLDSKP